VVLADPADLVVLRPGAVLLLPVAVVLAVRVDPVVGLAASVALALPRNL